MKGEFIRVGAAIAFLFACESRTEVAWDIRLTNAELSDRVARIETSIWRGGCDGVLVYEASISREQSGPAPALGRGLHGFRAEGRDSTCAIVAQGCIEYDVPLAAGERVELWLLPVDGQSACAPSECTMGTCVARDPHDAGLMDAAVDMVFFDASTPPARDAESRPDGGRPRPDMNDGGRRVRDGGGPIDAGTPLTVDAGVEQPGLFESDAGAEGTFDAGVVTEPAEHDAGAATPCDGMEWSEHCYYFEPATRSFDEAEALCVSWGGHLVSIGGPSEQAFVRDIAGPNAYWMGLTDRESEGTYTWTSGDSSTYRNWASMHPRAMRPEDDCVADQADRAGWAVRRCRDLNPAVCER